MKTIVISALVTACLATPAISCAQSFIQELDRISQAVEMAKQCDALSKAGGMDERCRALMIPVVTPTATTATTTATATAAVPVGEDKRSTKTATRSAAYSDDIDVISYTATGTAATIDAVVANRIHRMRVGDSVAGWKLGELSEYEATFQSNDKAKRTLVVAFRLPPAAPPVATTGVPGYPQSTGPGAQPLTGPMSAPMPMPIGMPGTTSMSR